MSESRDFEKWLQATADATQAEPVPHWPREATFRESTVRQRRWWQQSWLSVASLACSALAVMAVVTQLQVQVTDQGFNVHFGGTLTEQQLQQAVAAQMADYGAAQKVQFADYAANLRKDFRDDIAAANQQLVSYVLATNRTERQEDMEDLIRYVNAQREDDQVYFEHQLSQVTGQLIEQTDLGGYPNYETKE
ncbi:hypothetical protein CWI80_11255 [Pseudidiomarina sediminum]|uniref:Uncharacterized protein n=1 Tax=Pseudidiomarina sediminum TaxID=431675 RepID=A0A432Z0V5_9GAMM|nr:hypothetical protein [Pseudidiomarina sediminum]RUO69789.1 hypothetical protein CWI80_11255 [Pseudidiomarina sediminum]